jgi:hypothetical protein
MWYDRINEIMRKSAQKSALGQRIPESAVTAATAGALETEYNRAFSNAASLRNQESQARTQEKTLASNEKIAAENVAANERMNTANLSAKERMFNEGLDFSKDQAESQSISNIAQMGVTAAPSIIEYGKKGWDFLTTPSSTTDAISSTEAYQAGPWSYEATTGMATDITTAEIAAKTGSAVFGETALMGASEVAAGELAGASGVEMAFESSGLFGTLGTEASAAVGVAESGAIASTVESAVAGAWQTAATAGMEGAATAVAGEAAAVAGEGMFSSFLASAGTAISAIGMVVPFIGLAFVALSFIAPEVTGAIVDAVSDVVNTVVDVVSDVVNTVVDTVSDVFDSSIVCTELARQGYLPYSVLADENLARVIYVDKNVYEGYIKLFTPVVKRMKTSRLLTQLIRPFGVAVAYELASKVNSKYKGSILGKLVLNIGSPICRLAPRMAEVY